MGPEEVREGGEGMDVRKGRGGGVLGGVGALGSSLRNGLAYKPPSLNTHHHYFSQYNAACSIRPGKKGELNKKCPVQSANRLRLCPLQGVLVPSFE